jgi:hypothetical protein
MIVITFVVDTWLVGGPFPLVTVVLGAISTCDCQIWEPFPPVTVRFGSHFHLWLLFWEPFPPVTVVLGAISICDCCFGSHFHLWLSDLGSHFHLWLSDLGAISTCDCQIWEPFPPVTVRFGSHFHLWLLFWEPFQPVAVRFGGSHFNLRAVRFGIFSFLWLSVLGAISTFDCQTGRGHRNHARSPRPKMNSARKPNLKYRRLINFMPKNNVQEWKANDTTAIAVNGRVGKRTHHFLAYLSNMMDVLDRKWYEWEII